MRFALERALYFNYANSNYFFDTFTERRVGDRSKKIVVGDETEQKLISLLCAINEADISIREINWIKRLQNMIRYIVRYCIICSGINKIANHIRYSINNLKQRNTHPKILFCVQSERIVRYLESISSKMPIPYAYITCDEKAANYLRNKDIPFIYPSKFGYFLERWSKRKDILYKSVIMDKYDMIYNSLGRIKPKTVVVAEGNTPYDEITNKICKQLNIQSVCVQQGWAFFVGHTGFRNMTYSKMLVWGNGIVRNLSLYNPDQNFIVTGSHIISTKDFKTKEISTVTLFFQGKTFIINEKTSREFILLVERITLECPRIKVVIREHPLYAFSSIEKERFEKIGVIFMPPLKYSLDEVFEENDLTISIFSSIILESMAAGIIPMVFNPNLFPSYFSNIDVRGIGIEIKSVEEAISTIKRLIKNPDEIRKYHEPIERFKQEYFNFNKETAIKNIISEIIN